MVIGVVTVELYIPYSHSLKEKRTVVKGIKDSLKHHHNVSVAEVDHLDLWQRSRIAFVAVAGDHTGCEKILTSALRDVESRCPGEVLDVTTDYM